MASLCDLKPISWVSMPGTHDTMAYDYDKFGVDPKFIKTQTLSLSTQLNSGIRALDIRCKIENNDDTYFFTIYHGDFYLGAVFGGDVLQPVVSFLVDNPSEFILIRVKHEGGPYSDEEKQQFAEIFDTYWNDASYSDYFYHAPTSLSIPNVGSARGKIIILQDFVSPDGTIYGIKYGHGDNIFSIQDEYALGSKTELYDKWINVKNQLIASNNYYNQYSAHKYISNSDLNKFYINYFSASVSGWQDIANDYNPFLPSNEVNPWFVASGHVNAGTSASRENTDKCNSDEYPDFPRKHARDFFQWLLGYDCVYYEGTNILGYDFMASLNFAGIIMIDFPGKDLIERIISKNGMCSYFLRACALPCLCVHVCACCSLNTCTFVSTFTSKS